MLTFEQWDFACADSQAGIASARQHLKHVRIIFDTAKTLALICSEVTSKRKKRLHRQECCCKLILQPWHHEECLHIETPQHLAEVPPVKAKLIGSDDDFAALPNATPSQQAAPAAPASGPAAASAAASSSGLVWDKPQAFALHNFVVSLLELQGGRDDNQTMWEDVAAMSDLWGSWKPTAAELRHVYDQVRVVTFAGAYCSCRRCMF